VLKKTLLILLTIVVAIVLLVAPLAIRWFYYYEGSYQPGKVSRPDLTQIEEPLTEPQPFADRQVTAGSGTVLVDLAHANRVQMAELSVLQARLAARGHRLEPIADADDLAGQLRHAQALVIVSPAEDWSADEIQQAVDFVDKGGRLLLVTDPSRFEPLFDEWGGFIGLDYDAPHINDLAARFGLLFQEDYLYNTVDNAGNYRNIKLTGLATDPLTRGLEQIVFFATHSIVSDAPALVTASGETRSSASEQDQDLTVALLAAGGGVLALGDLTFMTEPHNTVYDNARFIANIADFLTSARRQYELSDFPFFFGPQVDLVYTGSPLLGSSLLEGGSSLQTLFADEGRVLALRVTEDEDRDTLFFGLYEQAEEVEPYLAEAQVTLLITPTESLQEQEPEVSPGTKPEASTSPTLTQPATVTVPITPTEKLEGEAEGEAAPAPKNRIAIEPLGEMALTATSLLLRQTDGQREVMVVLAHTEEGLTNALDRLTEGDLANCLLHETEASTVSLLALCPTGEKAEGDEGGGWQKPPAEEEPPPLEPGEEEVPPPEPGDEEPPPPEGPEPPSEPEGSILIVALDDGTGRYDSLTSADDYAGILEERYEITIWSAARDGPPDMMDLLEYDLAIWTAGDFEDVMGDEYDDLLFTAMFEGIPLILSGAYVGDTATEAVQRDIQVQNATHPLASGFESGGVIDFVPAPSGAEYEVGVLEDFQEDEGSMIFVRGPNSGESGIASIVTLEDEFSGFRLVFIGFPLYLLPDAPKSDLVTNAVSWLLSP
jgi:hypothetical protein